MIPQLIADKILPDGPVAAQPRPAPSRTGPDGFAAVLAEGRSLAARWPTLAEDAAATITPNGTSHDHDARAVNEDSPDGDPLPPGLPTPVTFPLPQVGPLAVLPNVAPGWHSSGPVQESTQDAPDKAGASVRPGGADAGADAAGRASDIATRTLSDTVTSSVARSASEMPGPALGPAAGGTAAEDRARGADRAVQTPSAAGTTWGPGRADRLDSTVDQAGLRNRAAPPGQTRAAGVTGLPPGIQQSTHGSVPVEDAVRIPRDTAYARVSGRERAESFFVATTANGAAGHGQTLPVAGAVQWAGVAAPSAWAAAVVEPALLVPAAFQDGGGWQPTPGSDAGGRLTTPVSITGQPAAQVAASVANQIAVAVGNGGGSAQVTLSPQELGTVRLGLYAQDMAITLTILAERPETAELIRRHIDTLAQEFREMGYQEVNFSFGGTGPGSGDARKARAAGPPTDAAASDPLIDPTLSIVPGPSRVGTSALDLRL